jgi:hypothetical protein
MKRLIWVDGRLAWPLVAIIAYVTASLVLTDYAWRLFVLPVGTLMIGAMLASAAGALLLLALSFSLGSRRPAEEEGAARGRDQTE